MITLIKTMCNRNEHSIEDTITFDTSQKSVCIESRMGRPWIGGDELKAIFSRAKELGI